MQKLFLASFLTILIACGQPHSAGGNKGAKTNDILPPEEEVTPNITKLRQEYIEAYNKPKFFDSSFKGVGGEQLKVLCRYFCLFDSAIIIPKRYTYEDTTKSFITHSFAYEITILSNSDTILKRTVTKQDFAHLLPDYLRDYSVIFEPRFERNNSKRDAFDFSVSISIPITDVGRLYRFSIKRNGELIVGEDK